MLCRQIYHLVPGRVRQPHTAEQHPLVAMCRVIGHVFFEEHDRVASLVQRLTQRTPQSCVSIAPRRADRKSENDDLHTCSRLLVTGGPSINSLASPRINASVRSRASLSVNCTGGDFMK